jgi:predicted protein tyrosine phosphatase
MPKNILFVCNQNKNRSKAAELIYREEFNAKSAGLYNSKPLTKNQLSWADVVIVMEESQRNELAQRYPELSFKKRILSLDIPDIYNFKSPELAKLIKAKMNSFKELLV